MPKTTVGGIELVISSETSQARLQIDKLTASLRNLGNTVNQGGLASLEKGFRGLNTVLGGLSKINFTPLKDAVDNVKSLSSALNKLVTSTDSNKIDGIAQSLMDLSEWIGAIRFDKSQISSLERFGAALERIATNVKSARAGIDLARGSSRIFGTSQTDAEYAQSRRNDAFAAFQSADFTVATSNQQLVEFDTSLRGTTRSCEAYTYAMENVEQATMGATEATTALWTNLNRLGSSLTEPERRVRQMEDAYAAFTQADWASYNPSAFPIETITKGFDHLKNKLKETGKSLKEFFSSIQRIATYRLIRSALKMITQGLTEGIHNLALYSAAMNETDANAANSVMSDYATKFLEVKNAVGAAAMPVLVAIQPIIINVANAFITATNAINMFLSALNGGTGFTKASNAAVDYAASLKSASGSAKALKDATAGIDELNVISQDSGGGGGATSGMPDYSEMFSEEIIPQWLLDNLELIKTLVEAIGVALLGWKIASLFTDSLQQMLGVALALAGAFILVKGAIDGWQNGVDWENTIEMIAGTALVAGGLALAFGQIGAAIGLLVGGIVMVVVGLHDWITTGELSTETCWLLVAGIVAIGVGLALLTGSWIPLAVAAVVAIALVIYKYWDEIKEFAIGIWTSIKEFFEETWDAIKLKVEEVWEGIKTFFTETIPGIVEDIVKWFRELPSKLAYELGFALGSFKAWAENVGKWVVEEVPKIIEKIVKFFKELPDKIKEAIDKVKETISTWVTDAIGWVTENVPKVINSITDWFAKLPDALVNVGKNMIRALWNGILSMGNWLWDKVTGFLGDLGEFAREIFGSFGEGIEAGYESVPRYATGGYVGASGQLFIARESGPEMVGSIGGQTAVANNDQIVEAVASGCYNAFMSAMGNSSNNGTQTINVYLDGKQIEASVRGTKQRRGVSIANGGIYNFA